MRLSKILSLSTLLIGVALAAPIALATDIAHASGQGPDSKRIVSLGGSVTEILYLLDMEDQIAAVDDTSLFPAKALEEKPSVGYIRALNAEGVLAAKPGMILSEADAGPAEVVDILKSASVPFIMVPSSFTAEGILKKIKAVGKAVGAEDKADALAAGVKAELDETAKAVATIPQADRKKVLFILTIRDGRLMVAGNNSHAGSAIEMAGGTNLMHSFNGYKMVDDEALLSNPPDAIVLMQRDNHSFSDETLAALPALANSPAIKNGAIIRMNGGYLLGFGPRAAHAFADLAKQLYPDLPAIKALEEIAE